VEGDDSTKGMELLKNMNEKQILRYPVKVKEDTYIPISVSDFIFKVSFNEEWHTA
jgi:thioredoxin reductase